MMVTTKLLSLKSRIQNCPRDIFRHKYINPSNIYDTFGRLLLNSLGQTNLFETSSIDGTVVLILLLGCPNLTLMIHILFSKSRVQNCPGHILRST